MEENGEEFEAVVKCNQPLREGGVCVLAQLSFLFLYWLISGYVKYKTVSLMETRHRDPEWTLEEDQRQRKSQSTVADWGEDACVFPGQPFLGSLLALGAGHGAEC